MGFFALGQLGLVGVAHQRQVHEHRRLEAEILIDQNVLGDRGQPFLAAGHMGDLHQVVVHHIGHVIGRHAVGLEQHLHVDGFPGNVDLAIDAIHELAGAFGWDLHPHHGGLAGLHAARDFLGFQRQAASVIFRWLAGGSLGSAHFVETRGRAEAAEAVAVLDDLLDVGKIEVLALGLPVRAAGPADIGAFRPGQAAPFQRIEDLLFEFRRRAGGIRVFDAQDELAAVFLCKQIVEQRDVGSAHMRLACRRRCNAHPRRVVGHLVFARFLIRLNGARGGWRPAAIARWRRCGQARRGGERQALP